MQYFLKNSDEKFPKVYNRKSVWNNTPEQNGQRENPESTRTRKGMN